MREEIFQYVKKKYKVEPDYPFSTAPTYPVLRHKDNRKWFALIMDIPREKLGLEGSEHADIIRPMVISSRRKDSSAMMWMRRSLRTSECCLSGRLKE